MIYFFFFFFQAEDGIRDYKVTGVQTCALPICEALGHLHGQGLKRIAFYRAGEAAELAYVTLKEFGLEPVAVFDRQEDGVFLGFPVRPIAEAAAADFDAIVIATFERPEPELAELVGLGVPREKLLTLRRPLPAGGNASRP